MADRLTLSDFRRLRRWAEIAEEFDSWDGADEATLAKVLDRIPSPEARRTAAKLRAAALGEQHPQQGDL